MRLSIVISTFNAMNPLRRCLTTLEAELKRIPSLTWEIIVADDCSDDGTAQMLRAEFSNVRLLPAQRKGYFVQTVNRGYAASSGDYVLHCQSDVQVVESSVERLLSFMDSHPDAAMCACRWLTPSTDELQPANSHFTTLTSDLFEWTRLGWVFPRLRRSLREFHYMQSWNRLDNRVVDVNLSNFMIFRRKAIDELRQGKPLFDNRFIIFFCEDELCWQAQKQGWKTYHLGDTFVYHIGSFSMSKLKSTFLEKATLQDREAYHRIVLGPIRSLIFRAIYRVDCIITSLLRHSHVIQ